MSAPRSRLLLRLDADLAAAARAGEHLGASALRAQRAMVLIRHGDLVSAREELTALHQLAFASPHPQLAAWLHLAEGLMAYYTDFCTSAKDRLRRALALAEASGCHAVAAQAHGFLAQVAFSAYDYEGLRTHVQAGLAVADADDGVARARLNMVGGFTLHYAGDATGANAWYARSRYHAARAGDDAAVSALIHNSAQMRVAEVRHAELRGATATLAGLLPGVQSVHNYDQAMGVKSLDVLTPLLRAQVLVVIGEFAEAMALFEAHLPIALSTGLERMGSSLLADAAWCRARLGQQELALAQARECALEIDPATHEDDRALTRGRLAQLFDHLDLPEEAAAHRALAAQDWAVFSEQQRLLREALAGLEPA